MHATPTKAAERLNDLSKYIYGTTRLGDDAIPWGDRVKIARTAMDAGVWFHASHTYGDALKVLRAAFDEDRARVPRMIFKIGWNNIPELRDVIRQNLEPLGLERMDVAQLCIGYEGELALGYRAGGACYDEFRRLKDEGTVGRFVMEVFPWTAHIAAEGLRAGYTEGIVDGHIFYLNPLQRFATNDLWDLLQERGEPIVSMRTVGGGPVHRLRDVPGAAWKPYLQERAVQVAPIFERSGVESWTEFCVRFVHGFPGVRATVGSTSRADNLREFLDAMAGDGAGRIEPLPADIQGELAALHRRWSDETDAHAEPWTM